MPGVSSAEGQWQFQTSPELARTFYAQSHEMIDAVTATVLGAEAALIWLHAQPPDLERLRKSLHGVVNDGKRACELIVRLRELMDEGADSQSTNPAPLL